MDLVTPVPLSSVAEYTPQRLIERADYADARLTSTTRVPTPNTAKLLTLYKQACMDLHLELEDEEISQAERTKKAEEIRGYDQEFSDQEWFRENPASAIPENLLKLRKYTYWARYGDYAGHMASQLRKKAGSAKTAFSEANSGQFLWTDISQNIKKEEPSYKENCFRKIDTVTTTFAVYEACVHIGIDSDNMINLIHMYADRNKAFHKGLKEMLEGQKFLSIAKCIFDDLNELPSICPPELSDDESAMRALLEQLRDEWFDISSNPNEPEAWIRKPAIEEAYNALQKSKQAREQHDLSIAQRAENRKIALDEDIDLLLQAATNPEDGKLLKKGPTSPTTNKSGKSKKRKASQPIDVSNRSEAWKTIRKQQQQLHGDVLETLSKQREVNRIFSAYRAKYGSSLPAEGG